MNNPNTHPILPGSELKFPCWLKLRATGWNYVLGIKPYADELVERATHYSTNGPDQKPTEIPTGSGTEQSNGPRLITELPVDEAKAAFLRNIGEPVVRSSPAVAPQWADALLSDLRDVNSCLRTEVNYEHAVMSGEPSSPDCLTPAKVVRRWCAFLSELKHAPSPAAKGDGPSDTKRLEFELETANRRRAEAEAWTSHAARHYPAWFSTIEASFREAKRTAAIAGQGEGP